MKEGKLKKKFKEANDEARVSAKHTKEAKILKKKEKEKLQRKKYGSSQRNKQRECEKEESENSLVN